MLPTPTGKNGKQSVCLNYTGDRPLPAFATMYHGEKFNAETDIVAFS